MRAFAPAALQFDVSDKEEPTAQPKDVA